MSSFLEKLASLQAPRDLPSITVSISSRRQPLSDQTTKLEDGSPIIAPLDNIEQVLSWMPGQDDLCVASVRLKTSSGYGERSRDGVGLMADEEAQKMIICHDMMGGYVKDKYTQGQSDLQDYYFYHWSNIGAFIYFSHHFITIPPPGWTNAAHRNGVLSMGTVITEWEAGAKLCHSLLSDEFKLMEFSQQLVAMAQYYGFDGWLVNIENPIHPMLLERVYMLLSLLTSGMHDACPGSKVIWYDSVTINGQLKWQNQLNQLNKSFFDVCDGIFLNYNWTDSGLSASRSLAGERRGEVYVGIDVFGRGCFGYRDRDLGYDSNKALEAINRHGLSSALFAPGWVFENQDKRYFFDNQDRFWSLLSPLCPTADLTCLPLVSSFGRGCGERVYIDGKVVYSGSWSNHSTQDLQPSFQSALSPSGGMIKNDIQSAVVLHRAKVDTSIGYNNGACLKLEGAVRKTSGLSKPSLARLFKTDLSLADPLMVVYTFLKEPTPKGYKYFLQLHTSGSPSRVFLDPLAKPVDTRGSEELLKGCGLPRSRDMPHLPGCVLAPLPEPHSSTLHQIFTGSHPEEDNQWKTCYFVVDRSELKGSRVTEVSLGFYMAGAAGTSAGETVSVTLGEFKILDLSCISLNFDLSMISNVCCSDIKFSDDKTSLSLTLSWATSDNARDPIDQCNIYSSTIIGSSEDSSGTPWKSDHIFLGRAHTNAFRVKDLYILSSDLHKTSFSVEFRVQPVTASRRKPSVSNSECLLVKVVP